MAEGYIYVLQNKAFGANVVKIGLTTRTPDVRAREIYAGASGVPLPFEIAVAYSVVDCARAEKMAHRALKTYRLNNRREFFRITSSVGALIVREICEQVNKEVGAPAPSRLDFPSLSSPARRRDTILDIEADGGDRVVVTHVEIASLRKSPVGTSSLSEQQLVRARILYDVLAKISPIARDKWLEGFTRDWHPERELLVWEHVAMAYMTLDHADDAPEGYRSEAFELLLHRSLAPTTNVLSEMKLKYFSPSTAKRLLDAYELKPKPIVITRGLRDR
jgi:hypothetical protein